MDLSFAIAGLENAGTDLGLRQRKRNRNRNRSENVNGKCARDRRRVQHNKERTPHEARDDAAALRVRIIGQRFALRLRQLCGLCCGAGPSSGGALGDGKRRWDVLKALAMLAGLRKVNDDDDGEAAAA